MKATMWIALGFALIVVLLIGVALGAGLLGYGFPGGMMGRTGGYGYPFGMMGGWGWGIGGLVIMGLMMLVPLGFRVVLVAGIVGLVRALSVPPAPLAPPASAAPASTCPACHQNTQADWQNCPYCGSSLKR